MSSKILACVASVSARVRRKNWNESKKSNPLHLHSSFFALVPILSTNSRGNACYAGYQKSTSCGNFAKSSFCDRHLQQNVHPENVLRVPRNYPIANDHYRRTSSDCFSAAFLSFVLRGSRFFIFI